MNQLDIPESWLAFQSIFYLEVSGERRVFSGVRLAVMTARTNREVFVVKDQESVSMIRYATQLLFILMLEDHFRVDRLHIFACFRVF